MRIFIKNNCFKEVAVLSFILELLSFVLDVSATFFITLAIVLSVLLFTREVVFTITNNNAGLKIFKSLPARSVSVLFIPLIFAGLGFISVSVSGEIINKQAGELIHGGEFHISDTRELGLVLRLFERGASVQEVADITGIDSYDISKAYLMLLEADHRTIRILRRGTSR